MLNVLVSVPSTFVNIHFVALIAFLRLLTVTLDLFFEDDPDTLLTSILTKSLRHVLSLPAEIRWYKKRHKKWRACALFFFFLHARCTCVSACVCISGQNTPWGPHDVTALLTYMPPTSQPPREKRAAGKGRDTDSTLHSAHTHALMHECTHTRADVGAN